MVRTNPDRRIRAPKHTGAHAHTQRCRCGDYVTACRLDKNGIRKHIPFFKREKDQFRTIENFDSCKACAVKAC